MAKQNVTPQETSINEAVSKTESFFENNQKLIIGVIALLLLAVGGWYCYNHYVVEPNKTDAQKAIFEAQYRFEEENPDYELILNGDANGAGLLEVIEQYGSTPAGNLAKHYAGVCYLHLGDLDNAAKYLAQYSPVKNSIPAEVINAQNYGLQGDVAVEAGDLEKAVKFFDKAVNASDNSYTAPLYLYKKGLALKALNKSDEAVKVFNKILNDYPASPNAMDAQKLIGSEE